MNVVREPVLRAERVRPGTAPALAGLDLSCERGSVTVLTGPTADETSRWLEVLAVLRPATGCLRILDDRDARDVRQRIGYADTRAPLLSTSDVRMNVMLPRLYHWRESRAKAARVADRILDHLGYAGPRDEPPARLDALETIQALVARALALDPPLLIIDEPFDVAIAPHWQSLGNRIRALASDDGRAVLVATRNLAFAAAHADQLVFVAGEALHVHADWPSFASDPGVAQFIDRMPFAVKALP